jgi:hypothetical protein
VTSQLGTRKKKNKHHTVQAKAKASIATRVIDAHSHVLEPLEMWGQYLEPEFRDKAPYFIKAAVWPV